MVLVIHGRLKRPEAFFFGMNLLMASVMVSLKKFQFLSTKFASGLFWKNVSSAVFKNRFTDSQSAFLNKWMILGFFLFCLARMFALSRRIWLWSLIPGPVVQLVTSSGQEENASSRMLFFLVGSWLSWSRLWSSAIDSNRSHACLSGIDGVWDRFSQLIPCRLKSPPRRISADGYCSQTLFSEAFSSWRWSMDALGRR